MDLELRNKAIIVTGGAQGIGKAICCVLSQEDAIPIILDKNEKAIERTVREIKQSGGECDFCYLDLTDSKNCESVVSKISKDHGQIDGLVNNAGINDGVGLKNGSVADFKRSIENNLTHYFLMTQLCLPHLTKSKGSIVNISSKVADTGQGGTSGYAAANGGRNALTREWALELLPYSVRVNGVLVSEALTPQYEQWLQSFQDSLKKRKEIESNIPLESRMTEPVEIANMVCFLLSAKSSHTTGQLIYVDGGYRHLDRAFVNKQ